MTAAATPRGRLKVAVVGVRGLPHVIGGIETHCAQLYPALADRAPEFDVRVLVRRRYASARRATLGRVVLVSLWAPSGDGLETLAHTPLALLHARFREGARLVHLHAIGPGFFAPLARLLGMKVVVTHHASDFLRPKWGWAGRTFLRWGERLAARFAHRVICVSDALAEEFLERHPTARARTEVVRHGIAPPHAAARDDGVLGELGLTPGRYLLAVGRYDGTKRFEELVAAHRRAGAGALPLVIVGAGDRAIAARLRDLAGERVRLAGPRTGPALAALYRHAAALVHPSAMEGFGLVVLEALAAGLPVRASDIPVHREFGLPDGSYFPVDDPAALAAVLAELGPRDAPCRESLALAERHSLSRTVAEHHRILRDVAGLADLPAERFTLAAAGVARRRR